MSAEAGSGPVRAASDRAPALLGFVAMSRQPRIAQGSFADELDHFFDGLI
jgi:hypothetical protein